MRFEGEEVTGGSEVQIRQYKGDIDVPLTVDEFVELRVTARVSSVNHVVNEKTGQLTRVHILYLKEVDVAGQ